MKGKVPIILVAAALILVLGLQIGFCQEKEEARLDAGTIIRKLNEVLANQAEILKQFEEIKQELAIIKVRASR